MTKHTQSMDELESHLQEHLRFLEISADAYDNGFEGEAKRMAVSIRVLVHDTKQSKSLLGQLKRKSRQFLDTSLPIVPENKVAHSGLVLTSIVPSSGAKYVPYLDNGPYGKGEFRDFDLWWGATVFIDSKKRQLSRKDIVLMTANQDGGAHVDAKIDSKYADLTRHNSLGWVYTDGCKSEPLAGPVNAALRQICHEVLKTLIPNYHKEPVYPEGGIVAGGMVLRIDKQDSPTPVKQAIRNNKVGRNAPCPCRSGKKFKRCCGKFS